MRDTPLRTEGTTAFLSITIGMMHRFFASVEIKEKHDDYDYALEITAFSTCFIENNVEQESNSGFLEGDNRLFIKLLFCCMF